MIVPHGVKADNKFDRNLPTILKRKGKSSWEIQLSTLITAIELVLLPPHDSFGHSLIHPFHKEVPCTSQVLGTELGAGYSVVSRVDTDFIEIIVWQERKPNRQLLSFEAYLFCFIQTHQANLSASVMPAIMHNQAPSSPWHLYLSAWHLDCFRTGLKSALSNHASLNYWCGSWLNQGEWNWWGEKRSNTSGGGFYGLTGEPICTRWWCAFLTSAMKHRRPRDHKSGIVHPTLETSHNLPQ